MQIGEKNFLSGKEETRRNPDGFREFLTQPDEKFSVKIRARLLVQLLNIAEVLDHVFS
jgi:hypothetical protein